MRFILLEQYSLSLNSFSGLPTRVLHGFNGTCFSHARYKNTCTYDNINPEIANWPFPVSGTDMKRIYTYALERWGLLVKIFDKSTPSPTTFNLIPTPLICICLHQSK